MKQVKSFLILILFFQVLYSQGRFFSKETKEDFFFNDQIFFSYWINPVQFEENLIFNYHIRYDFLLFEKTPPNKILADTFQAKIKVILELSSDDLLIPIRTIEEAIIKTSEFEQTISKNIFYASNFSLKVSNKKYKATLTIYDYIRNKEFTSRPFEINLENENTFEPVFIKKDDLEKLSSTELKSKFYNFLPFSSESYYLILPDREEFKEIRIRDNFVNYNLKRIDNLGYRFSIFAIDTLDLIESQYDLIWNDGKENIKKFFVKWIDKPEYLKNFDNALKILNYIFENDNSLKKYLTDHQERQRKFFELWKKFDPTPKTPFNELMAEFYKRADYSSIEFKTISQPDGAQTDRGKIYILYGPPTKIERTFASDGRAMEIWTYNANRGLRFTFLDENKNGTYVLQK